MTRLRKLPTLLVALCVVAAGVAILVTHTPSSVFDANDTVDIRSAALIQRGEYLARVSDCIACHSTPKSAPFSGGLAMNTPMGVIFSTNITPDKNTGIGTYTLADFDRALRHGVAQDGHRLYPAMPYPSYAKMNDDDVRALYAYFLHGVSPARQQNAPSGIPWPLNMRWPLALWNAVFTEHDTYEPKSAQPAQSSLWNRGAYLVQGPAHCGACHTPRGITMNELAFDESDARYLAGGSIDGWFAPSLRGDHNTGLGRWSEDEIYRFLKSGRNAHAVVYGSMADVFNNSTQFTSDVDLKAIAVYLKSLPGDPSGEGAAWQYEAKSTEALSVTQRMNIPGAQTFAARCSACHGVDGNGQGQWIPPLAGAASTMTRDAASSINVTLNGSARVVADGIPDAYHMPAYRDQLSDREIAEVLTFVRQAWGNHGDAIKPDTVKALRDTTLPSNGEVVTLRSH